MTKKIEKDIKYLDEHFPKGNKKRGEAMVLLSLARIEGKKNIEKQKVVKKDCLKQKKNVSTTDSFDGKSPMDIQLIKEKVLTNWKGQNEFVDWLDKFCNGESK
jgi:hypothetical protein